jgi:hypothetical protein
MKRIKAYHNFELLVESAKNKIMDVLFDEISEEEIEDLFVNITDQGFYVEIESHYIKLDNSLPELTSAQKLFYEELGTICDINPLTIERLVTQDSTIIEWDITIKYIVDKDSTTQERLQDYFVLINELKKISKRYKLTLNNKDPLRKLTIHTPVSQNKDALKLLLQEMYNEEFKFLADKYSRERIDGFFSRRISGDDKYYKFNKEGKAYIRCKSRKWDSSEEAKESLYTELGWKYDETFKRVADIRESEPFKFAGGRVRVLDTDQVAYAKNVYFFEVTMNYTDEELKSGKSKGKDIYKKLAFLNKLIKKLGTK